MTKAQFHDRKTRLLSAIIQIYNQQTEVLKLYYNTLNKSSLPILRLQGD